MLVVLLCCMMKIVENVVGKPEPKKKKVRYKRRIPKNSKGKAMNEVGVVGRGTALTPDSDCNSNHPGSVSCLSNTSSQDIDFIQDNSDYQWFLDYGYRDNNHTSILSLAESYDASDIGYYDALAKNMDANLAEADMESFRTEDIHALLTNLPPMCTDHLSQENNRQGESYASVSGSIMAKFDFDSPHTSSQGEDSANSTTMSICKSELLFSPVKENPMLDANFSVDSLDCDLLNEHDIMLTCQANKDNYTIAFEGSMTMFSEESDFHDNDKSDVSSEDANWTRMLKKKLQNMRLDQSMTRSDCSTLTTWSKLKKLTGESQLRRLPSGNNNESSDETSSCNMNEATLKSQSMPNLTRNRLNKKINKSLILHQMSCSSSDSSTVRRRPVKVFDIQNQIQQISSRSTNGMSELSDMATSIDAGSTTSSDHSGKQNFSLVKLFMKQKSMSAEGMSTALDNSCTSENWPSDSNISESKQIEQITSNRSNEVIVEDQEDGGKIEVEEEFKSDESKIKEKLSNNNNSVEKKKDYRSTATNTKRLNSIGVSISSESSNSSIIQSEIDRKRSSKISKCVPLKLINKSMQTSVTDIFKNPPYKLTGSIKERVKVVEPSFLNKLKEKSEVAKPVYVLYPSYALPNLDFLNNKDDDIANILLMPQPVNSVSTPPKRRPFSCNDFDALKKKGFSHVQDWDSLNILLPKEFKTILADVPEVAHHFAKKREKSNSNNWKERARPMSCDYGSLEKTSSTSSTATQPSSGYRGSSTLLTDSQNSPNLNPLFVYRYDSVTSSEASSMNNEKPLVTVTAPPLPKRSISLAGDVPPRPPLPRSILRKGIDNKLIGNKKRYSLIETNEESIENLNKRSSLHEPYYLPRNKRLSETEDEGVDAGTSSSSFDEHERTFTPPPNIDPLFNNLNYEDIYQLEEFLKLSGVSLSDTDNDESITQLRSYVTKFLSLKINQDNSKKVSFAPQKHFVPNNSPNVSALLLNRNHQTKTLVDMAICEEGETSPESYSSPLATPQKYDVNQKRNLVTTVGESVERLMQHFSSATNQNELNTIGDSELNPSCAKLTLNTLCPALYTLLSDGLKSSIETSFGAINNSVWQVVEASAQQGPLTKALNELVMRINGEDTLSEGLVKFNAFVFGLLNVRSLDAWISYLRTRESIIKKHYNANSLLVLSLTGSVTIRGILDSLIVALQPLALLPFQFDLLFEYRQLHESLRRMDSYQHPTSPIHKIHKYSTYSFSGSDTDEVSCATAIHHASQPNNEEQGLPDLLNSSKRVPPKARPRSCIDPGCYSKPGFKLAEDVASIAKKRWSGVPLTSKLYQAYNRLAIDSEEEYTDSLETHYHQQAQVDDEALSHVENLPKDEGEENRVEPLNGKKFKKLQRKWEMLSGKEGGNDQTPPESPTHVKSKIPRPVISPVKPSGIPVAIPSPTGRGKIPTAINGGAIKKVPNLVKNNVIGKKNLTTTRTSRLDQLENNSNTPRIIPRPSSLPYKPANQTTKNSKITPPRRAVSTSVTRKTTTTQTPKVVKTLSHRLPSESGHLPYNEGERLKVVLEVDEQWLLCCRGTQKGLVPRSAVIPADNGRF
nr:uncharacterized protein LOC111428305 isoform X2 [Onthophagus taurus]